MPAIKFTQLILRLISRLCGVILICSSFVFAVSLLSFNSQDPSFNTVSTDDQIRNWMGSFGSHLADLSFQLIGFSSFVLCIIIFAIGVKMSSRAGIRHLFPKLTILPFCILCFSVIFSALPQPGWWEFNSLGGVNGHFILAKTAFIPRLVTVFFAIILGVIALSIIVEISIADWVYFFRYSFVTTRFFVSKLLEKKKPVQARIAKKSKLSESVAEMVEEEIHEVHSIDEIEEENFEEVEADREILKRQLKESKTKKPKRNSKSKYQLPDPELLTDRSSENRDKRISRDVVEKQGEL